jgi:hypothetical protein
MQRFIADGNVVRITRGLQTFIGNNGQQVPQLFFTLAIKRNYQAGQGDNRKYPTDFIHCKVTGRNAEIFNQYCSQVDQNGKIISRHLMVEGEITTYPTKRKVDVPALQVNLGGQLYNIQPDPVEIDDTGYTLEIDRISFLDYKNGNVANNGATVQAQATAQVTPINAQPVQVAPVNAQPVAQPVAPAPVAQAVSQPVVAEAQPAMVQPTMVMNAPTEAVGPAPF